MHYNPRSGQFNHKIHTLGVQVNLAPRSGRQLFVVFSKHDCRSMLIGLLLTKKKKNWTAIRIGP